MTHDLMKKLERFQGELAKRVLCWPRNHSNTAATLAVGLQSMQSRILGRKLSFLQHILDSDGESVSVPGEGVSGARRDVWSEVCREDGAG